jgi:hypothetical protein
VSANKRRLVAVLALGLAAVGCTAGDDAAPDETGPPASSTPAATGPSPGVTDDAVKVGITYVDLEAISDVVDIGHGDYEAAYTALIDAVNAEGGVHGRTIEPTILGINPTLTDSAESTCVRLTEDEDVFLVMGFFLTGDDTSCVVNTHATALLGGPQTDELLAQAQAPWFTTVPGSDAVGDVVRAMLDGDVLDGTVGVFGRDTEQALIDDTVLPLLEDAGVDVADTAVNDAPANDTVAGNALTAVIAERFESEGVDQVLTVGDSGLVWMLGAEPLDYRPQMLLTSTNSALAVVGDPGAHDLSVLDGAVAGNLYGPPQNQYELDGIQACLGVLADAGIEIAAPDTFEDGAQVTPYTSAFAACNDVALLRTLLEAAGEDLNYGSLAAGADGLEVDLPMQPEPVTYGPPPSADGDPPMYLYDWDPDHIEFVLREG